MTKKHELWLAAVLTFLAAEAVIRSYWLAGGRWGYTACDRTHLVNPTGGCGADQVTALPFWAGWGALGVGMALAAVVGVALWRPTLSIAAWTAAAVLGTAAFPLNLLFELPAAATGRPTDWRDLLARSALLAGGVAFAGLATSLGAPHPPVDTVYRPVAPWTRRTAYVAVAVPLLGWALPHALWVFGVPFGISAAEIDDIRHNLSPGAAIAITAVPPLAGLLTLGLVQRWGQHFPDWVPALGGRAVPRLLALVPAVAVSIALMAYGALSVYALIRSLADGTKSWPDLTQGWAVFTELLVFIAWGGALGATAIGYHDATRAAPASQVTAQACSSVLQPVQLVRQGFGDGTDAAV